MANPTDASDAPEVQTGAGEPTLPGDAITGSAAPEAPEPFTGSGAPPETGPEAEASAFGSTAVDVPPKAPEPAQPAPFGGHGVPHVVQDNVSEPGVQKTSNLVDGSESTHTTLGSAAPVDDED